jgi:hypothetical protein
MWPFDPHLNPHLEAESREEAGRRRVWWGRTKRERGIYT